MNVGGKLFTTYYDTLKRSSYFQELIQNKKGDHAIAIQVEAQQESYFIDRDGDMFEVILHYLRSCDISGKTPAQLKKLKEETAFFKFEELIMKVDQALYASSIEENKENLEVKGITDVISQIHADVTGPLQELDPKIIYKYSYYGNSRTTSAMIVKN